MKEKGMDVRPFFYPLSDMPVYSKYVFSAKISKTLSQRGFNLPTIENIDFDAVKKIFKELAK